MADDKIKLSDFISEVKKELLKDNDDGPKLLYIDEVTVEVNVVASREKSGGGGIAFHIFNMKGDVKNSEGTTQKVVVRMKPIIPMKEIIEELSKDEEIKQYWKKIKPIIKKAESPLKGSTIPVTENDY